MPTEQQITSTRIRNDVYGFLAQAFRTPPTEEMLRVLADGGTEQAKEMGLVPTADFAELRRVIEADYNRTFLNMGPHAISPFESVYTSKEHLLMQDSRDKVLAAFRAQGVEIATTENLPEDHVAFELGFMQHVGAKMVEAFEAGNNEEADRLFEVQKAFYNNHLAVWLPKFCEEALKRVSTPYYQQVCQALVAIVEEDQAFFA